MLAFSFDVYQSLALFEFDFLVLACESLECSLISTGCCSPKVVETQTVGAEKQQANDFTGFHMLQ